MDIVGIKIISDNDMTKCIKIVRKYSGRSVNEIRDSIINNRYVVEGNYHITEDILLIIKLYNELCENKIKSELFVENEKSTVEILRNIVESQYIIEEQIREVKDQEANE